MSAFWVGVLSSFVAAALFGAIGYLIRGERYRRRLESAPHKFVKELGELINRAGRDGKQNVALNARAIVSLRNTVGSHITAIRDLLNHEIDELERHLGRRDVGRRPLDRRSQVSLDRRVDRESKKLELSDERLYGLIKVLERTWTSKCDQVELEIQKMLVVLGLDKA